MILDFAVLLAACVAGSIIGHLLGALAPRMVARMNHTPWPGPDRPPPRHREPSVNHHVAPELAKAATMIALAAAVLALLLLGGCAGHGPLGTDLGLVDGTISVTDPQGNTCNVKVTNGKDQTNLELEGLHVCGASIDKLHADRSDGAQAAINANAQVVTSLGGQLIGLLGSAITMLAPVPVPHGPAPAPRPVPPPPPPPHASTSLLMLEAPDL